MLTVTDVRARLGQVRPGTGQVLAEDGRWRILVDLHTADRVGIECSRVHVRAVSAQTSGRAMTAAWAEALCGRLSYLQEPLRICESDPDQVLVRSWPLGPADAGAAFYELRLCRSGVEAVALCRYVVDRCTRRRSRVNMLFSYDVLTRLVNDVLDTAPAEEAACAD